MRRVLAVALLVSLPAAAEAVGWRWAFLVLVPGPVLGALTMTAPATAACAITASTSAFDTTLCPSVSSVAPGAPAG